jgi:hypothetical protein
MTEGKGKAPERGTEDFAQGGLGHTKANFLRLASASGARRAGKSSWHKGALGCHGSSRAVVGEGFAPAPGMKARLPAGTRKRLKRWGPGPPHQRRRQSCHLPPPLKAGGASGKAVRCISWLRRLKTRFLGCGARPPDAVGPMLRLGCSSPPFSFRVGGRRHTSAHSRHSGLKRLGQVAFLYVDAW